jgi:hypothetical protein
MQIRIPGLIPIFLAAFAMAVGGAEPGAAQGVKSAAGVESPIKTQIEASDAVRRRIDRYFTEAVKKQKDGCDLYETTITELEYFSTKGGVNASADVEYGQPVAFSKDFMESLKAYAKFRLTEFRNVCPPPGETQTAQRQESGTPAETDPEPLSPPGGLRARLDGPGGGMTSIDPPKGATSGKDGGAPATGTLITTLQGPGGRPIIIVEDPDGKRWISTDGGKTRNYFEIAPPAREAKIDAPAMHRTDMSRGTRQSANAAKGAGDAQKKDGVMRAQEAVEESNRQIGMVQRDLRELAGTENPKEAIINTQGRISDLDKQISGVEGVLVRAGATQEDLKEMKEKWEGEWVVKGKDFLPNSEEKAARLLARTKWIEARLPFIGPVANITTWLGRKWIKEVDISKFEEYIKQGQIQINTAHELLAELYIQKGIELGTLRELRRLQEQLVDAQNDAAKAYARLDEETKRRDLTSGPAKSKAVLGREMDNEGDAQLRKESARDAVRDGIKLAPGEKPVTSKAPTITNKKPSKTTAQKSKAATTSKAAAKSAPAQTNDAANQIGQQIMQGLIQGGIQYGIGSALGSGSGHGNAHRGDGGRTTMNRSGGNKATSKTTTTAPAAGGGAGKSYLFQGFTVNPGR